MKKLIFGFFFFLSVLHAKAQEVDVLTKDEIAESEKRINIDRQKIKDNHITSIRSYFYKPDSTKTSSQAYLSGESSYDENGNLTEFKIYKKNGKIKYHYTYQWNENGKETEFNWWKPNGKMLSKLTTSYDSSGNTTDAREFWKSPENMTWHSVSRYDDKQNLVELKYLLNNDTKIFEHYVYTYYPDGSKKQTIEYNRKNKVKHIWNFDCNPAGKSETQNLKDTSKICVRYETDKDGNKIKIKEENTKGTKIARIISRYDHNNNLVEVSEYDSKEREKNHYYYTYDEKNNETEFISYRANTAQIKERFVSEYDTTGNLIEEVAYKKSSMPDHIVKFNYIKRS